MDECQIPDMKDDENGRVIDVSPCVHWVGNERVTAMNIHRCVRDSLLLGFSDGSARVVRMSDCGGIVSLVSSLWMCDVECVECSEGEQWSFRQQSCELSREQSDSRRGCIHMSRS